MVTATLGAYRRIDTREASSRLCRDACNPLIQLRSGSGFGVHSAGQKEAVAQLSGAQTGGHEAAERPHAIAVRGGDGGGAHRGGGRPAAKLRGLPKVSGGVGHAASRSTHQRGGIFIASSILTAIGRDGLRLPVASSCAKLGLTPAFAISALAKAFASVVSGCAMNRVSHNAKFPASGFFRNVRWD